ELMKSCGGKVKTHVIDIRDAAAVDAMVQRIWDESGPLTGLVNNAAGNFISPTKDLTPNGFNAIANTVFHGTFYVTHAVGKRWIAGGLPGSVLTIVVTWVHTGSPYVVPSAMSKAGLHVMTKSLAVEWGRHGIRLNAIAPGPFPTEGAAKRLRPGGGFEDTTHLNPMRRIGRMEELQNLASFLMADGCEWLTGETIALDGAGVFPVGALDAADSDLKRRILGSLPPEPPAEYYIAAVRECFEEAGVALLCGRNGKQISSSHAEKLMHLRTRPFIELLEKEDLYIPAGELVYYANWITAPGRSRRFDARFFVAVAPEGQEGSHDAAETVQHLWIRPREALARGERGEIELVFATQHTLRDLMTFRDPESALQQVRLRPAVETNRACWAQGKEGAKLFRRADPQYFEIHWSDPEETGQSSYDLVPGLPKRLDRLVTRLIAPNPGMMTGPGTNTYLLGERELAVID